MNIERILFPTDFSSYSSKARGHAVYLGKKLDSTIYILHAVEPIEYKEYDEEIRTFYKDLENAMEMKIGEEKKLFENEGVKVQSSIVIGKRWRVINTFAKEKVIDLIVMGSHGLKTEEGEVSVGTTSHKVIFTAPCPVLMVRY